MVLLGIIRHLVISIGKIRLDYLQEYSPTSLTFPFFNLRGRLVTFEKVLQTRFR